MSADRYEITVTDILARVEYPNGCTAEFFADTSARDRFAFAAIRQQARDLEQLRTDLAAAVARAEQAEARLAAIEVAPMVARVVEIKRDFASGPYRCLDYDSDKLPGGFVELIARPAKD